MLGSRRHRPPKPVLTAATANPNAAMAAAAVFNKGRDQQQPSLSAAAAAAALRSRPMTPTNVSEVQTKRTMRRSTSVSSSGTAPDNQSRPRLQRRGSSASMTERTFRSPSPGTRRPSSSGGDGILAQAAQSREPLPPVPALPKNVDRIANTQHRKTQSLGMSSPPFRVASQRLGKPGTGSWFGAAQVGDLSSVRTSDAAMASPPLSPPPQLAHQGDDERPDSRNSSINFSYPSRVRVGSPPVSPTPVSPTGPSSESQPGSQLQNQAARQASAGSSSVKNRQLASSSVQSMVYDPNSRRMVPREEVYPSNYDQQGSTTTRSPSLRKKRKQVSKTGTHLSQGTMGRTKVAPVAAVYEDVHEAQPVPSAVERAREYGSEPGTHQTQATLYRKAEDGTSRRVRHEGADSDNLTNLEHVENGRVPFSSHAARQVTIPRPEEAQAQAPYEELAVKSLVPSPRPEATQTEPHASRASLPPTGQAEGGNSGGGAPREYNWVGQGVRRQPSTVKEEPEPEDEEPQSHHGHTVADALDAVPTRQKIYQPSPRQVEPKIADAQEDNTPAAAQQPASRQSMRPASSSPGPEPKPILLQPRTATSIQRERSLSSSPARIARFGTVQENLAVRHCPPPRSVSPRKSALKQSSSPDRGASIDDNISEASSGFNHRDDAAIARKKSVRVSFDDSNNVVVGKSPGPDMGDSPILASPQNSARRPWYSNIGRSKKMESPTHDEDELMKPRPVLPSFGSIRDKKPRENVAGNEERALVRPAIEPVSSRSISASPTILPAIPPVSDELRSEASNTIATSGDYSIGSSQSESEHRAKIAANISRFREPLPPVVTSIEGSGYVSDTSSSEDDHTEAVGSEEVGWKDADVAPATLPQARQQETISGLSQLEARQTVPGASVASSEASFQDAPTVADDKGKGVERDIPTIAVSQPTPPPTKSPRDRYFILPGGFPEDDSDLSTPDAEDTHDRSKSHPMSEIPNSNAPTRQATFEPIFQAEDGVQTTHTPATVAATLAPVGEEDDDGSSIYSDANDHFTDTENEGFLSLDAVVDSPLPSMTRQPGYEAIASHSVLEPAEMGASITGRSSQESAATESHPQLETELSTATTAVETTQPGEPVQYDWEKAKAYWRSLTAEKRAQLEREAADDAGMEGDLEESPGASQSPKKKKSVERRNSERRALAVHMAQQMIAAQQQKQAQSEPSPAAPAAPAAKHAIAERTYMIKPGTKAPMPRGTEDQPKSKSTSNKVDTAPRLRTSMRTNGSISKASQPEQPRAHALGGKTLRPTSVSQPISAPKAGKAPQRVSLPPAPANTATNSFSPPPPPLRRRGSADSESSFTRVRPESSQGGFGFRKTLRQASPAQNNAGGGRGPSGRFSLRSMSPPSPMNRPGPPLSTGMGMRHSLRGPAKQSKSSGGGMNIGGFRKSSGKGSTSKASSSRFSDSSDDDAGPTRFRSRFDESSDEDDVRSPASPTVSMAKTMRPDRKDTDVPDWKTPIVQRYPAPEPSPALPEEQEVSDEEPQHDEEKEVISPLPQRKNSRSGRGDLIGSPTATSPVVSPTEKSSRRGSFMSVLRRKKNKTGGIARPERMDSAARRDTKLERTPDELKEIRRSGDLDREEEEDAGPVRPRSPRLQKRTHSMPLDSVVGAPWPLGSPAEGDGEKTIGAGLKRPSTSGNLGTRTMSGGGANGRPAFMQRRTVSSNLLGVGEEGSVLGGGGERKKKKFGALRKMFRLDD